MTMMKGNIMYKMIFSTKISKNKTKSIEVVKTYCSKVILFVKFRKKMMDINVDRYTICFLKII